MKINKEVPDLSQIHIRIITLGYAPQGESIMISLMDGDEMLYNIFTDCYQKTDLKYWINNLPEKTQVDAIIWTHPDEDHTKGIIELFDKFKQKETIMFVPTYLTSSLLKKWGKQGSSYIFDYFNNALKEGKTYKLHPLHSSNLCDAPITPLIFRISDYHNNKMQIDISFFLPNGEICQAIATKEKLNSGEMNNFSLAFFIEVDTGFRMMFGGDMTQKSLDQVGLDEDYFKDYIFVKIPHHGSNSPNLWTKIRPISETPFFAVTTTFKEKKNSGGEIIESNPSKKTLDMYAGLGRCKIFCTDEEKNEERGKNYDYGIVKTDFYLVNQKKVDIEIKGNATQVRGEKIFEDKNVKCKTIYL